MIQSEALEVNSAEQVETTNSLAETSKWSVASVFLAWLECNRGGDLLYKVYFGGRWRPLPFFSPVDQ